MTLPAKPVLSDNSFNKLTTIIHTLAGITIKPERKAMLEGRLVKRLRILGLADFETYIAYLDGCTTEQEEFVNAVTTNETYFYRTPRVWEYISEVYLDQWFAENKGATLNVWSAASSTGEEAHTLGIVLQAYKDTKPGFEYRITGTDIDTSVVQRAATGLYNGRSISRFRSEKPELFSRYMVGDDKRGFKVSPSIKKNIQFSQLNLFKPGKADRTYSLVLIRNVLIYFNKEDTVSAMQTVYERLEEKGVVIIGESESLNGLPTKFETIRPTIYQRDDSFERRNAA